MQSSVRMGILALAALTAACATEQKIATPDAPTRAGAVGMQDISHAVAGERVKLADNESFLVPLEDDANAMPVYPASLLAQQLPPQTVCMRVSVDESGGVLSSAPVAMPPDCPAQGQVDAAFFNAVSTAVAQWHYDPALRCVFPDAKTKENTVGSCGGYTEVPEAVSLTYRFVFEQKDGRGAVRMAQ